MLPLDQIDIAGAYVSPFAVVLLACFVAWWFIRRLTDALGLLPSIWHPALFFAAIYVILLSLFVLVRSGEPVFRPGWGL